MLVSLEWLNEYLDIKDMSSSQVAELLTSLGHEVEGIKDIAPVPETVVVGHITEASPHPKANSLQICQVDTGSGTPLRIVCGAANARTGLKVAVATIGTDFGEGFIIKPAKIRGEASEGMLCSEKELGISEEHDGIMELAEDLKTGTQVADIYPLHDSVFDISLTPNRGDCLSYLGLARDIAAKLKKPLREPEQKLTRSNWNGAEDFKVSIDADAGCARFTALAMRGLKAVKSPFWLQRRLSASGMRPINILVDITNYVLLETGQPVHAYDERHVAGRLLKVRSAHKNDRLETLDGNQASLEPGDLLICDADRPVGLAGVMGGANSEIKDDTDAMILEVAHFDPAQIRKTAKRLALHTEASHRFERGINIDGLAHVSLRVASLIQNCSAEAGHNGVEVADKMIDWYPQKRKTPRIALRLQRARSLLGMPHLTLNTCIRHLESLQLTLADKTSERMLFEIPGFRNDLCREVDLIEEVGRLEGFDKVPYELPRMNISTGAEQPQIRFAEKVRNTLATLGMSECISFPFHSESDYRNLNIEPGHPCWPDLKLQNPLSEEFSRLNTSLVPSLLKAVIRNRHHGQKGSKLFETGRSYFDFSTTPLATSTYPFFAHLDQKPGHYTERAAAEKNRLIERNIIGGICDHPFVRQSWQTKEEAPAFYHGKELLTRLVRHFTDRELQWERPSDPAELPWLHPGASAVIKYGDEIIGYLGELHPRVGLNWGLKTGFPVLFELDTEGLMNVCKNPVRADAGQGRFPAVLRDLALVVQRDIPYQQLKDAVSQFPERKFLKTFELFDLYDGSGVAEDKKSLAASFTFGCDEKTLTDKEVEQETNKLLTWLKKETGAELR